MSGISQPPARQLGPLAMAFWDLKKAPRASRFCVGLPARVRAGSAHPRRTYFFVGGGYHGGK